MRRREEKTKPGRKRTYLGASAIWHHFAANLAEYKIARMLVATWNINSVQARLPHLLQWLDACRPDVLCLQEIKCVEERFPREAVERLGYKAEVFGQKAYNGVAILARGNITDVRRGLACGVGEEQARLLRATVNGITIVTAYVPNGQAVGTEKYEFKLEWMRHLRNMFDIEFELTDRVLLCGDLNVAPEEVDVHDVRLWNGRILFSMPERAALANITDWGFADAFRLHTKDGGHYSWWDYRAGSFRRNRGVRIDHILVSPALARGCTGSWIDKLPRCWEKPSDHAPVLAELEDTRTEG